MSRLGIDRKSEGCAKSSLMTGPQATWTPQDVAQRLEEAADTLANLPPARIGGYASTWPAILRDGEGWRGRRTKASAGSPTPQAIDQLDEALTWLFTLEVTEMRVVWLRASGVGWKQIASLTAMHRTTAWRHWTCALIKVAGHLNGMQAAKVLQQKNTQQKRRSDVLSVSDSKQVRSQTASCQAKERIT